jgi:hypothetical protein
MNKIVNLVSATVLSGLMAGYAWADISSELVVSYPFDNNANDVSGNDYHGKVYGATQKEDRLRNRNLESDSYGFDGQSYIKTADITKFEDSSSISVTFWVSPYLYDNYLNVFGIGDIDEDSTNTTFRAEFQESNFYAFFNSNSIKVTGNTMVPVDEWTFIAMTYDELTKQGKLYVNGNLYNVVKVENKIKITSPMTLTIGVGYRADDEHFFQGKLDDFRMYSRSLSKADVQELYRKCPKEAVCVTEPADDEIPIDYYRDDEIGIWVDRPVWDLRYYPRGKFPDNLNEYGLRSLFLARYACWDSDIRSWMPQNLLEGAYYCTAPEKREDIINYLKVIIKRLELDEEDDKKRKSVSDEDDGGDDESVDEDDESVDEDDENGKSKDSSKK